VTAIDTGGALALSGEAQEVALAETQAVLAMARDDDYRSRLAEVVAAVAEGEVPGEEAELLQELLELGLQSGRVRAVYGPAGEQAALKLYRRLPRGAELVESAHEVSRALDSLTGKRIDSIALRAVGPGSFSLTVVAEGVELAIRLDRQGARLSSVGI
jgi:hypothetical protein